MAPAYVLLDDEVSSNDAFARSPGKTLLLSEGDDVQGIDFSMERGAVVAGKLTDAKGRPLVNERLTLIWKGQHQSNSLGKDFIKSGLTDDRGMYRIYGLVPGAYKIFAGPSENSSVLDGAVPQLPYKRTYYPGVTEPEDAKVLELTEGSELKNIDIRVVQTQPGFVVKGRVVDSATGEAISGLRFGLRYASNHNYSGAPWSSPSNSEGEFRVENVAPGKYQILILPARLEAISGSAALTTSSVPSDSMRSDPLSFEVVDRDVSGLLVKAFNGVTVAGTVVIDGKADSHTDAKLSGLRFSVFVRSETAFPDPGQIVAVNADGSFRVRGLTAGRASFSLISSSSGEPPVMFRMLRIERDGIADLGFLNINSDDKQITGVKIVLIYGTGVVRGEVRLKNGPLPGGGRLLVFLEKQGDLYSSRTGSADSRGRFLIEGVSAGDYELTVHATAARQRILSAPQSIKVTEGAITNVVVSLDVKEKSPPAPTP
jgi:hypothetical protein